MCCSDLWSECSNTANQKDSNVAALEISLNCQGGSVSICTFCTADLKTVLALMFEIRGNKNASAPLWRRFVGCGGGVWACGSIRFLISVLI